MAAAKIAVLKTTHTRTGNPVYCVTEIPPGEQEADIVGNVLSTGEDRYRVTAVHSLDSSDVEPHLNPFSSMEPDELITELKRQRYHALKTQGKEVFIL